MLPIRRLISLVGVVTAAVTLAACAGDDGTGSRPTGLVTGDLNTINSAEVIDGGTATYAIFSEIANWNRLHANGSTYSVIDLASVIMPSVFIIAPDGSPVLNEYLVEDARVRSQDPQTIVYTLRQDATWSDGEPITASDFVYTWKVQDSDQCAGCQPATTAGHDRIEYVEGSNDGKTVTVVLAENYSEWQQLFSAILPSHVAETYGPVDSPEGLAESFNIGFAENVPMWSAGPFMVTEYTSDGSVIMERNDRWAGPEPRLEGLVFRLITDTAQQVTALQNGEVDVIYPIPQVDSVGQVDGLRDVSYQTAPGFVAHQMFLNLNAEPLKDKALRQAIIMAIDAGEIVDKTIGQFDETAEPLRNHLFVDGQPGFEDIHSERQYGSGETAAAMDVLEDAGYTGMGAELTAPDGQPVPPLRLPIRGDQQSIKDEAELIRASLDELGIDVSVTTITDMIAVAQEGKWELALGNLSRSPFTATTQTPYYSTCPAGENFCGFNLGNYGNSEVDELFQSALTADSPADVEEHLREANELIADDYAFLPLYQQRLFLAYRNDLANVRANSIRFPTYNAHEWGYRE